MNTERAGSGDEVRASRWFQPAHAARGLAFIGVYRCPFAVLLHLSVRAAARAVPEHLLFLPATLRNSR